MSSSQAYLGVTITENNAYSILLQILSQDGIFQNASYGAQTRACMEFLGGSTMTASTVLNKIKTSLDTYRTSGQLTVSVADVLELSTIRV